MSAAATLLFAAFQSTGVWSAGPSLPVPAANNAVAAVEHEGGWEVYSFLGLDETKRWSGVHTRVFRHRVGSDERFREIAPLDGPGRLAGTAQSVGGLVYVFGGYTVAEDGSERSVPTVEVLRPGSGWRQGAPIPVPTDDAVSGVLADSLVYLVSGWHDDGNIADVQVFDPTADTWSMATPIPGPPVFGHAGGLTRRTLVYIDGVRVDPEPRRFVLESSSWRGDIDPDDPTQVRWRRIADHPGPPLYRAAAVGLGDWVIFAGGSTNPYNYSGVGYDGRPAEPEAGVFAYNVVTDSWRALPSLDTPTMDHRGIVRVADELWIIGGFESGQQVTTRVSVAKIEELLGR